MMRAFALGVSSVVLACSGLAAQETVPDELLKDPATAKRYAFYFSGAGHFYTGEHGRAVAMMGVSAISGYKLIDELACSAASNAIYADLGCKRSRALLWLGLMAAPYVYGIFDAEKSANRVNARLRGTRVALLPHATVTADGQVSAGLLLTVALGKTR